MRRALGLLGGVVLTLLLLLTLAVLLGRGEGPVEALPSKGFALRIADFRPPEERKERPVQREQLPELPRRIPELSLALRPRPNPPHPRIEPPPMGLLPDLSIPLEADLPEELFRPEAASMGEEPRTYEASEVDTPPYPIRRPLPPYPREAKRRGIEGEVRVRVLVDRSGKVVKVEVVEARPKGVFEEAVVRTLKGWEFRPALKGGRPVDAWVAIPIRFELREG